MVNRRLNLRRPPFIGALGVALNRWSEPAVTKPSQSAAAEPEPLEGTKSPAILLLYGRNL